MQLALWDTACVAIFTRGTSLLSLFLVRLTSSGQEEYEVRQLQHFNLFLIGSQKQLSGCGPCPTPSPMLSSLLLHLIPLTHWKTSRLRYDMHLHLDLHHFWHVHCCIVDWGSSRALWSAYPGYPCWLQSRFATKQPTFGYTRQPLPLGNAWKGRACRSGYWGSCL